MHLLNSYKKGLIVLFSLLTIGSFYFAAQLEVHHELEAFFPQGDPDLKFLKKYQQKIAPDYNYLVVAVQRQTSVFDSVFLEKIHRFTQSADTLPFVRNSKSITNLSEPLQTPLGMVQVPLLHINEPSKLKQDSAEIMKDERWINRFITKDARTLTVIVETEPQLIQKQAETVNAALERLIEQFQFSKVYLAGKSNVQSVIVNKIEGEIIKFIIIGIIVLIIILYLIYRTFWGVIIPLVSVLIGLITFGGILGLIGKELTLLSSMFPTIMLIVGMSDVIHIMNHYITENQSGQSRLEAMKVTVREIGWATLLTSFTTAIGFCALVSSKLVPVRHFGLTAAFGVLWAYVIVLLFTVPCLLHFKADQLTKGRGFHTYPKRLLRWIQKTVYYRSRSIAIVSTGVVVVSFIGTLYINTNTYLFTDIPKHTTVYQDFRFFDRQMGGGRTLEIAILPQDKNRVNRLPVLRSTEKLVDYLKQQTYINAPMSPPMLYKSVNKALHGGQQQYYRLPEDGSSWQRCNEFIKKIPSKTFKKLMSQDRKMGRISGKVRDLGSERIAAMNDTINRWIDQHLDTSQVRFRHTGTSLVVDHNNKYLRQSLFSGLAVAFLLIGIGIGVMFRSYKMALLSFIPNILPLLIVGGIMGWGGITLKASTAIIFTVAYGIAVDDTIHFLTRYRLERGKGRSRHHSISNTLLGTGKAIFLTSLILLVGFGTLLTSNFETTQQEGLLICVTLLSAFIGDVFLLPVCIRWFRR